MLQDGLGIPFQRIDDPRTPCHKMGSRFSAFLLLHHGTKWGDVPVHWRIRANALVPSLMSLLPVSLARWPVPVFQTLPTHGNTWKHIISISGTRPCTVLPLLLHPLSLCLCLASSFATGRHRRPPPPHPTVSRAPRAAARGRTRRGAKWRGRGSPECGGDALVFARRQGPPLCSESDLCSPSCRFLSHPKVEIQINENKK